MSQQKAEESSRTRTGSHPDPLVNWLRKNGFPVTRENYLEMAYPTGLPEPWGAELEAQLPPELRHR
jgi:hypothetical protein